MGRPVVNISKLEKKTNRDIRRKKVELSASIKLLNLPDKDPLDFHIKNQQLSRLAISTFSSHGFGQ